VETADVAVIGAGAAGLATAIFCARRAPHLRVVCLDGARTIGAKILVSGGSRCNVTNRIVTEHDFWGGSSRVVRHVLRAFSADRAAAFFSEIGVALHEEEDGKLFPDTNRARTVLDALVEEARRVGIAIRPGHRVTAVARRDDGFHVSTPAGVIVCRAVAMATGGRSLPKSGSDGFGYELAQRLGHSLVPTTPALAPLILEDGFHQRLSGVAQPVAMTVRSEGASVRLTGSLLWTHFGASGPVVLNASRHWHRARADDRSVDVRVSLCADDDFASLERWLLGAGSERPRTSIGSVVAMRVPASVAAAWLERTGIDTETTMSHLTREERRRLIHALLDMPLDVRDSRGYNYAEVTAGGVPLDEIDPATMESRKCPGLYLVGEILDVDGRIGGFNFQWAWSTGWVAGQALARRCDTLCAVPRGPR
jgi:predicted Rossmann fold flavoprotein